MLCEIRKKSAESDQQLYHFEILHIYNLLLGAFQKQLLSIKKHAIMNEGHACFCKHKTCIHQRTSEAESGVTSEVKQKHQTWCL